MSAKLKWTVNGKTSERRVSGLVAFLIWLAVFSVTVLPWCFGWVYMLGLVFR